jgi:hypothetical protein
MAKCFQMLSDRWRVRTMGGVLRWGRVDVTGIHQGDVRSQTGQQDRAIRDDRSSGAPSGSRWSSVAIGSRYRAERPPERLRLVSASSESLPGEVR